MDVPEQEVVRKSIGKACERAGDEVEIVQGANAATTETMAVNLYGDSTG